MELWRCRTWQSQRSTSGQHLWLLNLIIRFVCSLLKKESSAPVSFVTTTAISGRDSFLNPTRRQTEAKRFTSWQPMTIESRWRCLLIELRTILTINFAWRLRNSFANRSMSAALNCLNRFLVTKMNRFVKRFLIICQKPKLKAAICSSFAMPQSKRGSPILVAMLLS